MRRGIGAYAAQPEKVVVRELVEAILQGRQPIELTATRLTDLDLPLDWTEQRRLLAS